MKTFIASAAAVALTALLAIPAPVAAASYGMGMGGGMGGGMNGGMGSQGQYVANQCQMHPNWQGCSDWRRNHDHWGQAQYRQWYRWNHGNLGNFAAGLFGFALGAAITGSMNQADQGSGYNTHVDRCEARYRSYNPRTDQYLGTDGRYHFCTL
ncbi:MULTISPECIES: BA14K family protein [unclassified Devosia]|uniref:BA14K family protein n=1 Tax=unclassified Devosia TaxID=196773 RepID=UPI000868EBFD|nr:MULTISPECIES: BA14K family protein [unclassified Devosia]ODS95435.1 MAG: hypothetical protein ABS47_03525 [Devosia sp. SCN 66-27]OJX22051.1 MAG: hypothetical protein BGO83_14345 [Devosia sp. 66-14]